MGILSVIFDIYLDGSNYEEDDPDTIIHVRIWLGIVNLKNVKHFKKDINK